MARKCVRMGRTGGRKVCRKYSTTAKKSSKKGNGSKRCAGLVKSGAKKGKLKKGYTWAKAKGSCPRKVA